ncbi:MAG: glycosyltransferase family 4 protein [Ignisphaera sp.]
MTMAITHICGKYRPSIDGLSNYVYNLTIRLKNKYKIFVITTDVIKHVNIFRAQIHNKSIELLDKNLCIMRLSTIPPYIPYFWSYGITFELIKQKKLLASSDVIHIHSYMQWHSDLSVILSERVNKPCVLTIHAYGYYNGWLLGMLSKLYHRSIAKYFLNKPDLVIVLDPIAYKFFTKLVPESKIRMIPNGIDYSRFSVAVPQETLQRIKSSLKLKRHVILYVGQLIPRKGVETLIRAFKLLVKKGYSDISLLIVGDGPEYDKLLKLMGSLQLTENVRILRNVSDDFLVFLYKVADLFVLPSYYEGLPTVILEAFASGLPVIATKVGGIPWLIKSSKAGVLIEPGDYASLSKAIENMLTDDSARKRMAMNASLYARSFDWNVIVSLVEELYKEVVSS